MTAGVAAAYRGRVMGELLGWSWLGDVYVELDFCWLDLDLG